MYTKKGVRTCVFGAECFPQNKCGWFQPIVHRSDRLQLMVREIANEIPSNTRVLMSISAQCGWQAGNVSAQHLTAFACSRYPALHHSTCLPELDRCSGRSVVPVYFCRSGDPIVHEKQTVDGYLKFLQQLPAPQSGSRLLSRDVAVMLCDQPNMVLNNRRFAIQTDQSCCELRPRLLLARARLRERPLICTAYVSGTVSSTTLLAHMQGGALLHK
jgi:hypothetical protein